MLSIEQLSQIVKEHLARIQICDNNDFGNKWIIADSKVGGRGLIATKDIKTNEILFIDDPIVRGPRSGTIIQRGCTVCGKIDNSSLFRCTNCGLLLCSEQCQNSSVHYDDCCIISGWPSKVPIEDVDNTLLSRALTSIRALLLNDDQKNLVRNLQAHILPQHASEIRDLKEYFDIPSEEEEFMSLVSCILDSNAFQIATRYGSKEMSMRGLYPVSSLLNHNCVPNTKYGFDKDYKICLDCGLRVPNNNICTLQSALGSLIGCLDFANVVDLEKFLINRVLKYVPKSNQIFMDLQCRIIWEFGEAEGLRWHEIENTIEQAYNILQGDISAPPDLELRRQYLGPGCHKPHAERFCILKSNDSKC
ncbi:unnamed protein product [Leptidea sinapis]|uniref:SET domain-containing protein n=1 Tax=Leptidea sinapis TaxID=189913 RepID=A0A5E4QUL6_9NEOP|nr:unnamed protein product [Leptidea sinapis]